MPDCSIIIVSYNTRELLRACLESILRERGNLSLEVLVIENGSKDGSADMIREFAPDVTLIEPGRNTWFVGGNNLGIERAQGETILLLNPDTVIQPGMLQAMLAYLRHDANEAVGCLTCRMAYPDGSPQRTCSRVPTYTDLLLSYTFLGALLPGWRDARRRSMWYSDWERDSTRPVEVAPGSCMLFPAQVLRDLGGLNPHLKLYFPEDDIALRLRGLGYETHFLAEALLVHHEQSSVKQVQRLASSIYFDDLMTFCRAHYGLLAGALLTLLAIPTRLGMNLAQRLRGERKRL